MIRRVLLIACLSLINYSVISQNYFDPITKSYTSFTQINSDFGQRNVDEGSIFHKGIDFQLSAFNKAYSIKGGGISRIRFTPGDVINFIKISNNWRYMHYPDANSNYTWEVIDNGDFMNRPAMKELLAYIDSKPHKKFVVVFDDLKRFARDTEFHFKLRTAFRIRDVIPKCLNYQFDDSPEGHFTETIFAAQAQLEREQNRRQVIQKQKSRLELGYWAFAAKKGYDQVHFSDHDTDMRNYAKYLLKEGSKTEKRELLSNLKSRIIYEDKELRLI